MQEESVAEMLLPLYFFAKAFYIGQGEAQPYPLELRATGPAVLSQVEHSAFTTLFSWDLKPKFPFFVSFLSCDSRRCRRGGSRQLAGDAHGSVRPLPPPQPPARLPSLLCVLYPPDSPSQAPLALFLNQPSCALAEGLGWEPHWSGDGAGQVKTAELRFGTRWI